METRVRRGVLFSFQRVKTEFFCVRDFRTVTLNMRQSIQEWTKWNLWKTALKNFELIWSGLLKQTISLQIFLRLSSANLNWSILEYFVPYILLYYFLKANFYKLQLVHSWIFCPIYTLILLATLVFFNTSNLVHCCWKDIFLTSVYAGVPWNSIFIVFFLI